MFTKSIAWDNGYVDANDQSCGTSKLCKTIMLSRSELPINQIS